MKSLFKADIELILPINQCKLEDLGHIQNLKAESKITDLKQHFLNDYDSVLVGKIDNKSFAYRSSPEFDIFEILINDTEYNEDNIHFLYLLNSEGINYEFEKVEALK